jgi:hypothetical protein
VAGESAWTKAERHRQMADRYERGAQGEEATAEALADLPAGEWTVIHDVAWPGRKLANIDHVVVGPSGVFVIDTKNWSGEITVDDDVLRQNGRARVSTVRGAEAAAEAVAALLPTVRRDHVHAVLCFTDSEAPSVPVGHVLVSSTSILVRLLSAGATVMSGEQVRAVAEALRSRLPAATEPRPRAQLTAATPRSKPRSRKRRLPKALVSATAGTVFVAVVLATNPAPFIALTNGVSDLITDQMAPPEDEPVEPQDKKDRARDTKKGHKNRSVNSQNGS